MAIEKFSRLVRFVATDGQTYFGDAILPNGETDARFAKEARVIVGDIFGSYIISNHISTIRKLLSPLSIDQVGTIRLLGLNYKGYAADAKSPLPKYPVLFYKPLATITGPTDPIPVPKMAQIEDVRVDYECELVIVIGKVARDVSVENALSYVLGYTAGDDVSQRTWIARVGGQLSNGKVFDAWSPIGPAIVNADLIPEPNNLKITTEVNGKLLQDDNTSDQVFGVKETISFLSQGATLYPGDLIFTGTPKGVGMLQKPFIWLRDGDIVKVGIENIGTIENKVIFEKGEPSKL